MENKEEKILWHITKRENLESILQNGIKANEQNEVFLLDEVELKHRDFDKIIWVSHYIALEQLCLDEFVIFAINADGLEIEPDNVAEITAKWQYIYKGDISPKRIKNYFFEDTKDLQAEYEKLHKRYKQ